MSDSLEIVRTTIYIHLKKFGYTNCTDTLFPHELTDRNRIEHVLTYNLQRHDNQLF